MLNAGMLLDRLDKISHKMPNYSLSYHESSATTHRPHYSLTNYETLKLNIKKIAEKKPKSLKPSSKIRLRSTIGTPRKHHYLELIQSYIHRPIITEPINISVNSSKATIIRPVSHRISSYTLRSPQKSPRTRYIKINIPTATQNLF